MTNLNPLSPRIEQLSQKIKQVKNTDYNRLKIHTDWQTHHIGAIEEHNRILENRVQELEGYSHNLENRIYELEQQNNDLLSRINQSQNLQSLQIDNQYPLAVLDNQNRVLNQLNDNTLFLQNLIQQKEEALQRKDKKITTMQHSVSWQFTGPLRASGKILHNVSETATQATKTVVKPIRQVQQYINQRPKLKTNLMKLTGLQKLYKNKA